MSTAALVSVTKDLMVAIAAIIGSVVAIAGLSTWRRQLGGQADHELARRILVALYKYRDAIGSVRNPFMYGNEFPEPPENQKGAMTSAQVRHYGLARAYGNRWERVQNQRADVYAGLLEAEALWGVKLRREIFPAVFNLESELQTCVRDHLILNDPDEQDDRKRVVKKMSAAKRDVLYDSLEKDGDEFSKDLGKAIETVEEYLKPKLARD